MSSGRPPSTRARPEAEPTSFDDAGRPVLRCAIYTGQSVARGEQDLTSCDVQRERCEDYVRAMQYEGWVALDERFDDLGVSDGNLERPALRRLLSWSVQGRVDVPRVTALQSRRHAAARKALAGTPHTEVVVINEARRQKPRVPVAA